MALLARLAREDHAAAIALAWLLCPAASLVAARLADRSGDIDGMVAGQMWVELTGGARTYERSVAANIIRAVQDAVRADLGVGRASVRSDPAWSRTAVVAELPEIAHGVFGPSSELDSSETLSAVVQQAVRCQIVTTAQAGHLLWLCRDAAAAGISGHRGRGGLTAPRTLMYMSSLRGISTRTLRRRTVELIDRLAAFVRVEMDLEEIANWFDLHEFPPVSCDDLLEIYADEVLVEREHRGRSA
ncbi:hypothetical protein [Nocardioides panacihumi]|uniref:hypothetical protein n=1 Tax=Nocardioides panacihumi TaxID=400774 RepID=UPI0031D0DAC3